MPSTDPTGTGGRADTAEPLRPAGDVAADEAADDAGSAHQSALFGRGLLYVLVFSLQTVAATVVSPVLAHLVGPNQFGELASAIALFQLLSVLAVLGLDQAVVLQWSADGDSHHARGLLVVCVVVAAVVVGVIALLGPWWAAAFGFGSFSPLLVATLLWTFFGAIVQAMLALLLAQDRLNVFSVVSGLAAVGGQVFGIVFLLVGSNTAVTYAWGGVLSQFLALGIGLAATRPRVAGLTQLRLARHAISLGLPLAVGNMATFILNAGDRIIIQRLLGAAEVGRYQIAYVIGYLGIMLLAFTNQAWTARFASIADVDERLALVQHSRDNLYRLLLPMILATTLAAPLGLRIIAPATFRPAGLAEVVLLVTLAALPVAACGASGRELFALRRGRSIAVATMTAAAVNVGLNFLLVPRIGLPGAALATLVAYGAQAVLQLRALPRTPRWPSAPGRLWAGVALVCGLAAASTALPESAPWLVARTALAAACLPWFLARLSVARGGSLPGWATALARPLTAAGRRTS